MEGSVGSEKFLVVNADDFGYCSKRNAGIVEAFCKGVVTSTSLMVNAVSSTEAVELGKENKIPMGLHLNLTEGRPLLGNHRTLVAKSGFFRGKEGLPDAIKQGIIDNNEIEAEIKTQLMWFRDNVGCNPTHVDGHQHIHVYHPVCSILAQVMTDMGISVTRNPVEVSVLSYPWMKFETTFFESMLGASEAALDVYSAAGISFPLHFVGISTMGDYMTNNRLQQVLTTAFRQTPDPAVKHNLPWSSTCELMVHPGYASTPGIGGCGEGPDMFALSQDREHELAILTGKDFKNFLDKNMFVLKSFHDLNQK